jgi:hypothetical protein
MLYFFSVISVVEPCHEIHRHLFKKKRNYKAGELSPMLSHIDNGIGGKRI